MTAKFRTNTVGAIAATALGLVFALQADAQGRPSGAGSPAAGHAGASRQPGIGTVHGWPRGSDTPAPSRLPEDKAFGEQGSDASAKGAANADGAAENGRAKAEAAIAAAGTGGPTGKGQGADAGVDGRATATAAVSAGTDDAVPDVTSEDAVTAEKAERSETSKGRSADAPGHTGQTGLTQAAIRANEHAQAGLDQAVSQQRDDEAGSRPLPRN